MAIEELERVAVLCFGWLAGEARAAARVLTLSARLAARGVEAIASARIEPRETLWVLRRNEVMLAVREGA